MGFGDAYLAVIIPGLLTHDNCESDVDNDGDNRHGDVEAFNLNLGCGIPQVNAGYADECNPNDETDNDYPFLEASLVVHSTKYLIVN